MLLSTPRITTFKIQNEGCIHQILICFRNWLYILVNYIFQLCEVTPSPQKELLYLYHHAFTTSFLCFCILCKFALLIHEYLFYIFTFILEDLLREHLQSLLSLYFTCTYAVFPIYFFTYSRKFYRKLDPTFNF